MHPAPRCTFWLPSAHILHLVCTCLSQISNKNTRITLTTPKVARGESEANMANVFLIQNLARTTKFPILVVHQLPTFGLNFPTLQSSYLTSKKEFQVFEINHLAFFVKYLPVNVYRWVINFIMSNLSNCYLKIITIDQHCNHFMMVFLHLVCSVCHFFMKEIFKKISTVLG